MIAKGYAGSMELLPDRIIVRRGIFSTETMVIPMAELEAIKFTEATLMDAGAIVLKTKADTARRVREMLVGSGTKISFGFRHRKQFRAVRDQLETYLVARPVTAHA